MPSAIGQVTAVFGPLRLSYECEVGELHFVFVRTSEDGSPLVP